MQQEQMIRTYQGKNLDKKFRNEARKLAGQGWLVQSQSYGGVRRAGFFGGLLGGRKPREMTVIFVKG